MSRPPECKARIDAFLERDLGGWTGLPARCPRADVESWWAFAEGSGLTHRGTRGAEYAFRVLEHPAFLQGVGFFFSPAALAFMETEYWSYDEEECAAVLERLGGSEATLDLWWRDSLVVSGLRLYPARGLALGVIPETGLIVTVTASPPCSAEHFAAHYQDVTQAREFRRP